MIMMWMKLIYIVVVRGQRGAHNNDVDEANLYRCRGGQRGAHDNDVDEANLYRCREGAQGRS